MFLFYFDMTYYPLAALAAQLSDTVYPLPLPHTPWYFFTFNVGSMVLFLAVAFLSFANDLFVLSLAYHSLIMTHAGFFYQTLHNVRRVITVFATRCHSVSDDMITAVLLILLFKAEITRKFVLLLCNILNFKA